jgi:hypothetical protein
VHGRAPFDRVEGAHEVGDLGARQDHVDEVFVVVEEAPHELRLADRLRDVRGFPAVPRKTARHRFTRSLRAVALLPTDPARLVDVASTRLEPGLPMPGICS